MVNGFDPATVPGIPADLISKMETEESKATSDSHSLVKVVRDGLVKDKTYLELISQVGSTPLEFFEDFVREEKDSLKHHKSNFKQLVKQNCIRMGSDVTFAQFEANLATFEWYSGQPKEIKVLLYEYYVYKIRHKEIEKENK